MQELRLEVKRKKKRNSQTMQMAGHFPALAYVNCFWRWKAGRPGAGAQGGAHFAGHSALPSGEAEGESPTGQAPEETEGGEREASRHPQGLFVFGTHSMFLFWQPGPLQIRRSTVEPWTCGATLGESSHKELGPPEKRRFTICMPPLRTETNCCGKPKKRPKKKRFQLSSTSLKADRKC